MWICQENLGKNFLSIKIIKVTKIIIGEITDLEIWRKQNTKKLNSSLKYSIAKEYNSQNFKEVPGIFQRNISCLHSVQGLKALNSLWRSNSALTVMMWAEKTCKNVFLLLLSSLFTEFAILTVNYPNCYSHKTWHFFN